MTDFFSKHISPVPHGFIQFEGKMFSDTHLVVYVENSEFLLFMVIDDIFEFCQYGDRCLSPLPSRKLADVIA